MRRAEILTLVVISVAVVFPWAAAAREPYANFYTPGKAVLCSMVADIQ
jgi:hypothetical protein